MSSEKYKNASVMLDVTYGNYNSEINQASNYYLMYMKIKILYKGIFYL